MILAMVKRLAGIVGLAVTMLVVFLLYVSLRGNLWHWIHGDFVTYRQWTIRIPEGFYVRQGNKGPFLWKLTFGYPIWRGPYAMVGFSELPHVFDSAVDYNKFADGSDLTAATEGYKPIGATDVQAGKNQAHCLEYTLPNDQSRHFMQCAVEHTTLLIGYRGHPMYIPTVLSVLASLSQAP
jgi:hypothetical protein